MTSKSVQRRVAIQRGGKEMSNNNVNKGDMPVFENSSNEGRVPFTADVDSVELLHASRYPEEAVHEIRQRREEIASLKAEYDQEKRRADLAEAKCAEMPEQIRKQIINEVASGRTINNFGHVPEVVRALEWVLMDIQGLKLKDSPGQTLLDRLEEAEADSKRLEWLVHSDALVAYSRDGEDCWLHWPYPEEEGEPINQPDRYTSPREAIDKALAACPKEGL